MGSKGRTPPQHLRRQLPGPGMGGHPEPYGHGTHPPPGSFPPFDMLPPPEVMEQKLAAQHGEMQRLATENQRLAATHGNLRQELAAAQHELQILHAQIGAEKSEREQQTRMLVDRISKMEAELQAPESVKLELQQARADAQNLVVARQELISKAQQLNQDLQRTHVEVQQIPALMSELESLRQEYQHCRATYDYEKKFYNDHLESLQVMQKNYMTMAQEMEKLRAELTNATNYDRRLGPVGPYGTPLGNNDNEPSGQPVGQNVYEDGYGFTQVRAPLPATGGGNGGVAAVNAAASGGSHAGYSGAQPGSAPAKPGYDAVRGPGYNASGVPAHDAQRGSSFDAQRGGTGFDAQRGGTGFDVQRGGPGYDLPRGPAYDASRGSAYDPQARGVVGHQGHTVLPGKNATPPGRGGAGYEVPSRGGNPVQR